MRLQKWHWIVIASVVAIVANLFGVRAYLLWKRSSDKENPILKTYKAIGNCFYKTESATKWLFLSGEENIFDNTQLQTEVDGSVILSFAGANGKVEVSQNTELEVFKENPPLPNETVLDFKKGEVFVNYQAMDEKSFLIVRVGQRNFKLQNSDMYIFGEAKGQVAVSVDYGKVTMDIGEKNNVRGTNSFHNGQMIFFRNARDFSVEESLFKISTPLNYDRYSVEDEIHKVRFAYAPFKKDYYIQLFLGSSPFDIKPYFVRPQKMKNNEFFVALPRGSYYWRLGAASTSHGPIEFYSHTKRFFIEPKIRIQPVFPVASARYPLRSGKARIQFEWDNPSQLEKSFIEISDSRDFSRLLAHEPVSESNYFFYDFNHTGDYYWRVSGFPFKSSELINGVVRKIIITENDPKMYLKILFPRDGVSLTTNSFENSDVQFQWTKYPVRVQPQVRLEVYNQTTSKKYEFKTTDNFFKMRLLPPGKYRWHIVDDSSSQVISESAQFKVVKTNPLYFQNTQNSEIINWERGPKGTVSYHVGVVKIGSRTSLNEIFSNDDWSKKDLTTKKESFSMSRFSSGVYAFKIYAVDKEKNILADSSLKFVKITEKK